MKIVRIDRSIIEPTDVEKQAWQETKLDYQSAFARNRKTGCWETFSEPGDAFLELAGDEYDCVAIGASDPNEGHVCFLFIE